MAECTLLFVWLFWHGEARVADAPAAGGGAPVITWRNGAEPTGEKGSCWAGYFASKVDCPCKTTGRKRCPASPGSSRPA